QGQGVRRSSPDSAPAVADRQADAPALWPALGTHRAPARSLRATATRARTLGFPAATSDCSGSMERQARARTPLRALRPIDFSASRLPPRCHQSPTRGMSSYKDFWPIVAIEGAQMGQKSGPVKEPAEQVVREIRRATRRQFSAEEKIRIVLSGL